MVGPVAGGGCSKCFTIGNLDLEVLGSKTDVLLQNHRLQNDRQDSYDLASQTSLHPKAAFPTHWQKLGLGLEDGPDMKSYASGGAGTTKQKRSGTGTFPVHR